MAELLYMQAERDYHRELAIQFCPYKRLPLTNSWRRTFAELGQQVGWERLKDLCTIVQVATIQNWARRLAKGLLFKTQSRRGRPPTPPHIQKEIVRIFLETGKGTTTIAGIISNLYGSIDPRTVAAILRRHGLDPTRRRALQPPRWKPFITDKGDVIAAVDFFTTQVWSWLGKKTVSVLFIMHLASRKVEIAGITEYPDGIWMRQVARNLTMADDGFLSKHGCRYLIHDRDTKFCEAFKGMIESGGVECVKIPARSPNLNAFAERWVQSVKYECLKRIHCLGIGGLRHALREYLAHYHHERPHQGIGNVLIDPEKVVGCREGPVKRRTRLGGVLNHYYRDAA